MPYRVEQSLILLAVFSNLFTPAKVQIPLPMPVAMPAVMPQPVYAVPAPVPVAVAIHLPERERTTTTTTTTTPEPQYAIAVPVPMPMPVPFAVPAQPPPVFCQNKPPSNICPPCPPCVCLPSCTPAFFSYCSSCHQKCRCRNPAEAPVPLPPNPPVPIPGPMYPMPMVPGPVPPAPVVVVPLPPIIRKPITSYSDSDSSDSCDSTNERHYPKRGKKYRKGRIKILKKQKFRRDARFESGDDTDLVKPVISYISENGDVHFETKLSNKDAMKILSEGTIKTSDEKPDMESYDDLVLVEKGTGNSGRKYNKVNLRESLTNHQLKKGINEFVFKPSSKRKIDSLAVSFKVT